MNLASARTQPDIDVLLTASYAALSALEPATINAACPVAVTDAVRKEWRQSRAHEEDQAVGIDEQIRAAYSSPLFWRVMSFLPRNNISDRGYGRPQDYPDWLLSLFVVIAGVTGIATRNNACALLRDQQRWALFVADVDRFVPDGWTRLSDLAPDPGKVARRNRPRVTAETALSDNVVPLQSRTPPIITSDGLVTPPRPHHLDHFAQMWRGLKKVVVNGKQTWVPQDPAHRWYKVRQKVMREFRDAAAQQAMDMGMLDPNHEFRPSKPERRQFCGFDATVLPMNKNRPNPASDFHSVGGQTTKVYGSKWAVGSCRISGQAQSRTILDFAHIGNTPDSEYPDEGIATERMALALKGRTHGGMRGILVDSIIRGQRVINLQRRDIIVVNYPHAQSNPGSGPGTRLGPSRVEKSHLRATYRFHHGGNDYCHHPIYAVGGELLHLTVDGHGDAHIERPEKVRREKRLDKKTVRDYVNLRLECPHGPHVVRVPLFHTDATSTDPDYNWGEVVRFYPPSSEEFQYLYGGRNDTEARHADLKSRMKYLPKDVPGQQLRFLGAAIVINSVAWQTHLQAHGLPNVFDNTA